MLLRNHKRPLLFCTVFFVLLRQCESFSTTPKTTNTNQLAQLVDGAWVDDRICSAIFPGPLRGVAAVEHETIRPNTKIATIPAQNVLIVDNYQNIKNDLSLANDRMDSIASADLAMWDRDLAVLLWKEYLQVVQESKSVVKLERVSPLTGYIKYLCQQDEISLRKSSNYNSRYDEKYVPVLPFQNVDINSFVPISLTPHSVRRWKNEQKSFLAQYEAGQRLLQLQERQDMIWRMKYDSIRKGENTKYKNIRMSYAQFEWAMEVVTSRAFCGLPVLTSDSSQSSISALILSALPGIISPVLAATVGYIYAISTVYPNENVLIALAFAGALPLLVTSAQSFYSGVSDITSEKYKNMDLSAVLLPIIDSANHDDDAARDTDISYNPFRHTFEWFIGPKSLISMVWPTDVVQYQNPNDINIVVTAKSYAQRNEEAMPKQVCISYGNKKSDSEWLINHGFIPGIKFESDIDNFHQYRLFLAQTYLERNR
jgi:hypothetical protein